MEKSARGGSRRKLDAGVIDAILRFADDGLPNKEIAERLGISQTSVSRYLKGKRKMPGVNARGNITERTNDMENEILNNSPTVETPLPDGDALPCSEDAERLQRLEKNIVRVLEDRDCLSERLGASEREKDELRAVIRDFEVKCDALRAANRKLEEKCKILTVTVDGGREVALREENEQFRRECEKRANENAELKETVRVLTERMRKHEKDMADVDLMERDLSELASERRELLNRADALNKLCERQAAELERLEDAKGYICKLKNRSETMRRELMRLRRVVGTVLSECAYLVVPFDGQNEIPEIESFENLDGDLVFKKKRKDASAATETPDGFML